VTAIVLGFVALVTVALSFAFAAVVLLSQRPAPRGPAPPRVGDGHDDEGGVPATLSRVLADIERLAVLRERGALTDREFAAQKARLLKQPR